MIESAKQCGAGVWKTQLYDPKKLLDESQFLEADWNTILLSELTFNQVKNLKDYCDEIDIEFMASAFDLERLQWLEDLNVKRHKIASRSLYDREYVEAVYATGKPVVVSMGQYIERGQCDAKKNIPINVLRDNTTRLWCISKYPTYTNQLIGFPQVYGFYHGFSDHTLTTNAAKIAIARGARIVEKHFTFDRYDVGPDHYCSMLPNELKDLVEFRNFVASLP